MRWLVVTLVCLLAAQVSDARSLSQIPDRKQYVQLAMTFRGVSCGQIRNAARLLRNGARESVAEYFTERGYDSRIVNSVNAVLDPKCVNVRSGTTRFAAVRTSVSFSGFSTYDERDLLWAQFRLRACRGGYNQRIFAALARAISAQGLNVAYNKALRINPWGRFGWIEFVTPDNCRSPPSPRPSPSPRPPSPSPSPSPSTAVSPSPVSPSPNVTSPSPALSPSPNVTSPSPNVTSPSPNVTSPSPNVTSPSPNVTSPSPNVTSPSPGVSTSPDLTSPSPGVSTSPDLTSPSPGVSTSPDLTSPSPGVSTSPDLTSPSPGVSTSPDLTSPSPGISTSPDLTSPSPDLSTSPGVSTSPSPDV